MYNFEQFETSLNNNRRLNNFQKATKKVKMCGESIKNKRCGGSGRSVVNKENKLTDGFSPIL